MTRFLVSVLLVTVGACSGHTLRVREDNDFYAIAGTDRWYTQGAFVEVELPEEKTRELLGGVYPKLPLGGEPDHPVVAFGFGQQIFTPEDFKRREVIPDDRPFATWLFGSMRMLDVRAHPERRRGDELGQWELQLGVVGPSALGEELTDYVHEVINDNRPLGWTNQLGDEPGVVIGYDHAWRLAYGESRGPMRLQADLIGSLGASGGNVLTEGRARVTLRFGRLPRDFHTGEALANAVLLDADPGTLLGSVYGFVGLEGHAIARDIFLDGSTFESSHSVDKRPLVGIARAGVVVPLGDTRLTFLVRLWSPQFEERDGLHRVGTLMFEHRF